MLPASLMLSGSLNFFGGAKSKAVKVPDFLSKCLKAVSTSDTHDLFGSTYGDGIGASSSKALATGVKAGTVGEYGRLSPNGL